MITVVDYGLGNLGSIANMLKRIGVPCQVSSDAGCIDAATKLILPGVGAFDHGMRSLAVRGLAPSLQRRREIGTPILGICLGAQLMTSRSSEGVEPGLGWFSAETVRFESRDGLKVPNMGWAAVTPMGDSPLFSELEAYRFYFVHAYHFRATVPEEVCATATHGYVFPAALRRGNLFGVQFHPEKSHRYGMELLRRFADL